MPDSIRRATASARVTSRPKTAAARPYSLSLAAAIASSTPSTRTTATIGPKDSSEKSRISGVTRSTTVAGMISSRPPRR